MSQDADNTKLTLESLIAALGLIGDSPDFRFNI